MHYYGHCSSSGRYNNDNNNIKELCIKTILKITNLNNELEELHDVQVSLLGFFH